MPDDTTTTTTRDWLAWASTVLIPKAAGSQISARHFRNRLARRILLLLATSADTTGSTAITYATLADALGCTETMAGDVLGSLLLWGLLGRILHRQHDGPHYRYYLDPDHNPAYLALHSTTTEADHVHR